MFREQHADTGVERLPNYLSFHLLLWCCCYRAGDHRRCEPNDSNVTVAFKPTSSITEFLR
jgi:hypothetical protein